jgi:eukaryotic-like serine/threonine-protein kinase
VPFNASSFSELVLMVNIDRPPAIASVRDDVPHAIEAAILRCLEKQPENRFANVAELAWAIAEYGPPGSLESAERITRMIAPHSVRPAHMGPVSLRRGAAQEPPRSQPEPAQSQPAAPPTHVEPARTQVEPATMGAMTRSTGNAPAQPARKSSTGVVVGALLAVSMGAAAAFYLFSTKSKDPPVSAERAASAADTGAAPAPASAAPSSPAKPTVEAAATAEPSATASAEPAASASAEPPAASAAPSAPAANAPPPRAPKPAAPKPTATAAPATPAKANPLDIKMKD